MLSPFCSQQVTAAQHKPLSGPHTGSKYNFVFLSPGVALRVEIRLPLSGPNLVLPCSSLL